MAEPGDRYPQGYLEGLRLFNSREFWECHEELEGIWLQLEGEPRLFYQGLIQMAAAFHHVFHTGRWSAACRLFEQAREKLVGFSPRYMGLKVDDIVERLEQCRAAAARVEVGNRLPEETDDSMVFEVWPLDYPPFEDNQRPPV